MTDGSHLLRLPGELRNRIYDHVFDSITVLHINRKGFLVPPSIASVCRQLHEEVQASGYLGHSLATRPSIQKLEAHVVDFDFRHVIAFLTLVAEHGLAPVDYLFIRLRLTDAPLREELVLQWIDFMAANDECAYTYNIDIGDRTMKSIEVLYDVEMLHKSHRICKCWSILSGLGDLRSSEGLRSHWAEINGLLYCAVSFSHYFAERLRAEDNVDRALRRCLQGSELGRIYDMRHWIKKLEGALLGCEIMDASNLPPSARAFQAEPSSLRMAQAAVKLGAITRLYARAAGRGRKRIARQTWTSHTAKRRALRESLGVWPPRA